MERKRKLSIAKAAAIGLAIPFLIYAYEYGPDAGVAGVPGEAGTCNQAGCHTGTAVNGGGGNVTVTFPNGLTYTPGSKQHLVVTIADPALKRWGFELTARQQSDTTKMAGSFSPTDQYTQLMCDTKADLGIWIKEQNNKTACPASLPLEYVTHTLAGYQLTQNSPATFSFDWNTPATDVGPVTIYVAGNAGPNGAPTNLGCHIYTANYTLTPAAGGGSRPEIRSSNGVISASAYGAFSGISPGSWIEIYGSDLAPATAQWSSSDFNGPNAPTSLDGVSVSIGGQQAFTWYLSSNQLNVLVPSNVPVGTQQVVITTPDGTSDPYSVNVAGTQPGLLAPASFVIGGKQYVAALFSDNQTFAIPANAIAGVPSRPAKAGDVLTIYGIGFGPVTPDIPAGVVVSQANQVASPVQILFGSTPATLAYAGLAPNFTGLYQFNVTVPAVTANPAMPLQFTLGGNKGAQTLYIAVQ